MDDWKEQFNELFVGKTTQQLYSGFNTPRLVKNFISSLLSSQEQKHKKEIEELIEEIPDTIVFQSMKTNENLFKDNTEFKGLLKSKYLTKGKE